MSQYRENCFASSPTNATENALKCLSKDIKTLVIALKDVSLFTQDFFSCSNEPTSFCRPWHENAGGKSVRAIDVFIRHEKPHNVKKIAGNF